MLNFVKFSDFVIIYDFDKELNKQTLLLRVY